MQAPLSYYFAYAPSYISCRTSSSMHASSNKLYFYLNLLYCGLNCNPVKLSLQLIDDNMHFMRYCLLFCKYILMKFIEIYQIKFFILLKKIYKKKKKNFYKKERRKKKKKKI